MMEERKSVEEGENGDQSSSEANADEVGSLSDDENNELQKLPKMKKQ